jgi:polyisoprenoid-binding protein YceI
MTAYRIEPDHSEIYVEARSNVHPIEIRTQGLAGTIEVDVDAGTLRLSPAPRATLEISADLLRSGIELYDKEIHRMIEVRKYRAIKGELRETHEITPGRYRLTGSLQLHGVTRDIDGEVTVRIGDDGATLDIEGTKTLDMRDFNLDPPKILMLEVQPDVAVRAKIRAVRAA